MHFFMNYIFNHYYILQFTQNQFEESQQLTIN